MKAIIRKASDWSYKEVKEINNLEELLKIHTSLMLKPMDFLSIYTKKKTKE